MGSKYVKGLGLGIGSIFNYLSEHLILFNHSDFILNILRLFVQSRAFMQSLAWTNPTKYLYFSPKLQMRSVVTSLQHEVERLKEENKEVETVRAGGFFFLSLKLYVV